MSEMIDSQQRSWFDYRCGWNAILLHSPLAFMPTEIEDFIFRLVTKNFAAEKIAQLCKKTI